MKGLFYVAAIAAVSFVSCKKNNTEDAKPVTKENIMGSFKITAINVTLNGVQTDGMQALEACAKDDLYMFKAEDVFEYTDAGTKCDPEGDYSSSWTVADGSITVDGEQSSITLLTATRMETTSVVAEQGNSLTTKITFTRQ